MAKKTNDKRNKINKNLLKIDKDISEYRVSKGIEAYKNNLVNISGASEIAGLSYREFLKKLEINNIPLNMDTAPIEYGLLSIKKSLNKR